MLLKKIRHLKTTTKAIQIKIVQLNDKINKIESLEEKINLLEKENKELKDAFKNYKNVCSKDITVLASAITELYNILNIVFEGKLFQKSSYNNYEEKHFDDIGFFEDTDDFLFEEDPADKKKKKKIYH